MLPLNNLARKGLTDIIGLEVNVPNLSNDLLLDY